MKTVKWNKANLGKSETEIGIGVHAVDGVVGPHHELRGHARQINSQLFLYLSTQHQRNFTETLPRPSLVPPSSLLPPPSSLLIQTRAPSH